MLGLCSKVVYIESTDKNIKCEALIASDINVV